MRYKCLKNNVFVVFFITSYGYVSILRITSVSDQPLIKWSCRLLVGHHVFNRMNSLGIVLYLFLPTIISSGSVDGGIKEKRLEIFYYSGLYGAV